MALLRLPERLHSVDEMAGVVKQLEGVRSVITIIEDEDGITVLSLHGVTSERINWMLDRAKILLHNSAT